MERRMLVSCELMKTGCFTRHSIEGNVEVGCAVKLVWKVNAKEDYA